MIKLKSLTLKNFLSVGAITQTVDFSDAGLMLVLGENLDLGGNGAKNGVGKTCVFNGLSYALFGQAITNIKRDNLINTINKKNMVVSITFEKNGETYHIERGRKPNFFKYVVGDRSVDATGSDEAQGENKETQREIDTVLGLTHTMFKHIVCLNTYTEPFLQMGAGKQREIIEELLGITLLSQKAENLKELIRVTKTKIEQEEFQINTIRNSNQRIQNTISELDKKILQWDQSHQREIATIQQALRELRDLDVHAEIEAHKQNQLRADKLSQLQILKREASAKQNVLQQLQKTQSRLLQEYAHIQSHECPMCGSEMHDEKQLQMSERLEQEIAAQDAQIEEIVPQIQEFTQVIDTLQQELDDLPECACVYSDITQAYDHRNSIQQLEKELDKLQASENPYLDQKHALTDTLQDVSYDELNQLQLMKDHQEFLLRLLVNKDSFIRKKIIDQNLAYLNHRLTEYLNTLGILHEVRFVNDLSVEINYMGQDMDFAQLSRGESTRVILALSWAFRDIWENMNTHLNFMGVDELIDVGLDAAGVEKAMEVLKQMSRDRNKLVMLISHRDELLPRVDRVLTVIKEDSFTRLQMDYES
jgi:DNA repair exonuclease SbcCD ATPase subunit